MTSLCVWLLWRPKTMLQESSLITPSEVFLKEDFYGLYFEDISGLFSIFAFLRSKINKYSINIEHVSSHTKPMPPSSFVMDGKLIRFKIFSFDQCLFNKTRKIMFTLKKDAPNGFLEMFSCLSKTVTERKISFREY